MLDASIQPSFWRRARHASLRLLRLRPSDVLAGHRRARARRRRQYATFEQDQGQEKPGDPIEVRARPGNVYDFINEKGHATPVTFHALPNGEHVAQVKLEGSSGYGYVLARVTAKDVLVVPAECNKQDTAKMATLGVVPRNQYECRIDKVADPVAFFVGLRRSEPVSRMARE